MEPFSEKTIDVTMEMWEYVDAWLPDPSSERDVDDDAAYVARRLMRQAVGTRLVDERDG